MNKSENIKAYLASHPIDKKYILVGDAITDKELNIAKVRLSANERPLLLVKSSNWFTATFNALWGIKLSGFVISDKAMHWANLMPDSFFATLAPWFGRKTGMAALEDIKSVTLGRSDVCFGNAYEGHQLIINGSVVGLVRIGSGITFSDEVVDWLKALFNTCINE